MARKVGEVVGAILYILIIIISMLFALLLSWCKWFGFAWVLAHIWESIDPVQIGTILFIVFFIIQICAKILENLDKKEDKETKNEI